jgi:hypothetical protein
MPTVFTPEALQGMQATQELFLPDAATLYSSTTVSDGAGGNSETFLVGVTVNVRMGAPTGSLRIVAEKLDCGKTWQLTLAATQAIYIGQRLKVKGENYKVVYVDTPRSFNTATRALVVVG